MEDHPQLGHLNDQLTWLWKRMAQARERGDWKSYWSLRRSWLATGRLHSILIERIRAEQGAQLTLLEDGAGRAHDRAPS